MWGFTHHVKKREKKWLLLKRQEITNVVEDVEKGNPLALLVRM